METKSIKLSILLSVFLFQAIIQVFFLLNYPYFEIMKSFVMLINILSIVLYARAIKNNLTGY